eukprot:354728-Chlamydomonas_euryale.AAC.13
MRLVWPCVRLVWPQGKRAVSQYAFVRCGAQFACPSLGAWRDMAERKSPHGLVMQASLPKCMPEFHRPGWSVRCDLSEEGMVCEVRLIRGREEGAWKGWGAHSWQVRCLKLSHGTLHVRRCPCTASHGAMPEYRPCTHAHVTLPRGNPAPCSAADAALCMQRR